MSEKHAQSENKEKSIKGSPTEVPSSKLSEAAWQQAEQSSFDINVKDAIKIVQDGSSQKMEIPPVNYGDKQETSRSNSEHPAEAGRPNIANQVKIENAIGKLPPEQQQEVRQGITAIRNHDDKAIAKFMEKATPEEQAAFMKALESVGYKVEHTPPSAEELARIGAPTREHFRISDPNSLLPSGIDISISRNPSTGSMDQPTVNVALER